MVLLSVVLPTFNEGAQIQDLLDQVSAACQGIDYEVLVVDDNSPDGTIEKVREAARQNPRIMPLLRTTEKGLATAVIHGMKHARGTYIVCMDSDFQHPPKTLPDLLAAVQRENADLVVASRYALGGSVTGFPLMRRIISWGARTLSVVLLPSVRHHKITDPMSGFFLVRKDAVDPDTLKPRGYKILIEVIARARVERAAEVGFGFETRRAGESKLRLKTQYDYFLHVLTLAVHDRENRRLALFALVGVTGIIVNAGLFEILKRTKAYDWLDGQIDASEAVLLLIPASLAREASILWNFWWNDTLTFRDLREKAHAGFFWRVLRFNLVSVFSWIAYLGVFYFLITLTPLGHLTSLLIAIVLTFFLNYRGNRRWTYATRREAANG